MNFRSVHAAVRFGLGPNCTNPLPDDPEAWLAAQLDNAPPQSEQGRPDSLSAFAIWKGEEEYNNKLAHGIKADKPQLIGERCAADSWQTIHTMVTSDQPFRERLVLFWANHFTISARAGGGVLALMGAYLHEAIRPHVTGTFEDMLSAVMHHAAMLYYLQNDESVGPNSKFGRATGNGLNENLARECLELHTLGTSSGYTQDDVTNFARVLTGWSIERQTEPRGFVFRPDAHEPGPKKIMGMEFPEGYEGGMAALKWLAHHPSTYKQLAFRLVQHFTTDSPDPAEVAKIEDVLKQTGGDLKAATSVVTSLPAAWRPLTKMRTPMDYVFAVCRALNVPLKSPAELAGFGGLFDYLGQPFQVPPLPNGWSDTADAWLDSEHLLRRADWAFAMAGRSDAPDTQSVAAAYGPLLGSHTLEIVRGAASPREGLALLLASPELMRR